MSDCRMCDTCGTVFSVLDPDARRINIEEPVQVGARTEIQVIQRDACGQCARGMRRKPPGDQAGEQTRAIDATATVTA